MASLWPTRTLLEKRKRSQEDLGLYSTNPHDSKRQFSGPSSRGRSLQDHSPIPYRIYPIARNAEVRHISPDQDTPLQDQILIPYHIEPLPHRLEEPTTSPDGAEDTWSSIIAEYNSQKGPANKEILRKLHDCLREKVRKKAIAILKIKSCFRPTSPDGLLRVPNKYPSVLNISNDERDAIVRLHIPPFTPPSVEDFRLGTETPQSNGDHDVLPDTPCTDTDVIPSSSNTGSTKGDDCWFGISNQFHWPYERSRPRSKQHIGQDLTTVSGLDAQSPGPKPTKAIDSLTRMVNDIRLEENVSTDEEHTSALRPTIWEGSQARLLASVGRVPTPRTPHLSVPPQPKPEHRTISSILEAADETGPPSMERVHEFTFHDAIERSAIPKTLSQLEAIASTLADSIPFSSRIPHTRSQKHTHTFDLQAMLEEYSLPVHSSREPLAHQDALLAHLNFASSALPTPEQDGYALYLARKSDAAIEVFNEQMVNSTVEAILLEKVRKLEGEKEELRREKHDLEMENQWLRGMHEGDGLEESRLQNW